LSGVLRRKLAEAEEPPTTIGEWQERAVRLDRNQRQSRAEERMLGRNAARLGGNAQPRGGFGGGVIWRKRRTYNLAGRSSAYRRE